MINVRPTYLGCGWPDNTMSAAGLIFRKNVSLKKVERIICKILEGSMDSNAPDSDTHKPGFYATELFWIASGVVQRSA